MSATMYEGVFIMSSGCRAFHGSQNMRCEIESVSLQQA